MPRAVIYIDPDDPQGEKHAWERMDYIRRRGYKFWAIARRLDVVMSYLDDGTADIVVCVPTGARKPLGEEETRNLPDCYSAKARMHNHRDLWPVVNEVNAYREGYTDGYVDCATIKADPE